MAIATANKAGSTVVPAPSARSNLGRLLSRVEDERRSLVIAKSGTPKAVLLSIRDYVKLAAPEPELLRLLGGEAERNGTASLSSQQIDQIIAATRAQKKTKIITAREFVNVAAPHLMP